MTTYEEAMQMTLGERCDQVIALIDEMLDAGVSVSTAGAETKDDARPGGSRHHPSAFDSSPAQ